MVKIQEHIDKIEEIKKHISNSKGQQKKQFLKCYHRLQKGLMQCYMFLNKDKDVRYIKVIR